jgi:hypothetical protein
MERELKPSRTCPLCGSPVFVAFRIRQNEYVMYCALADNHTYLEGVGDTPDLARERFLKKCEDRQKTLL